MLSDRNALGAGYRKYDPSLDEGQMTNDDRSIRRSSSVTWSKKSRLKSATGCA
jgi:hypothetical protein